MQHRPARQLCARRQRCGCRSAPATSSSSPTSSTTSAPTRPACTTCCSRSTRRRPSTSTWSRSQAMDNPVFYVQMAHARIASIERVAAERGVDAPAARRRRPLAARPRARARRAALAVRAARRGRAGAATSGRRTRSTTWVRELAGRVPRLLPRLLRDGRRRQPELTQARLWLVEAARIGLAIGLDLLGVSRARSRCERP